MKSIVVILLTYLLLVAPCFAIGSENTNSDVYEIDYRGPETHNSRPPPETLHGKRPFIHHKTSAAGSAGAHVGGQMVFWCLKDCPIPESLNPGLVCANIKKSLEKKGYDGLLSIKAYYDKETFSDELFAKKYRDAGIDLIPVPAGGKTARDYKMMWDIVLCGVDNVKGIDFLVILKPVEPEFLLTLSYLEPRGYNVILASPDKEVASEFVLRSVSSVWLSTSLLEQGDLDELSNIRITNFDDFNSPQELEALGTVRLKIELQSRRMKCGGTLQARAARLFLLKSTPLDKLPKKFKC
ncbi:unnamed protein product [Brassica oleracea var. botrytis]|uniref:(rape) hypothetical protein n=1 Tax=Brassica napus TaxID=3708 RepID=A0A816JYU1_BRANA|nr:unnamed protein product [Brassica napus]